MNKLRLGIFPNMKKENVKNSLPKVLDLCDKAEIEAVLPQRLDYQDRPSYDVCDRASLKQMHMAVSLGGDGTLLQMTRFLAPLKIPVFGVNFGKLGFLAEIELKELPEALSKLTAGEYVLEERSQLQACVWRDGKVLIDAHALNDMVVAKGQFSKLAHLSLKVNGKRSGNYALTVSSWQRLQALLRIRYRQGGRLYIPASMLLLLHLSALMRFIQDRF